MSLRNARGAWGYDTGFTLSYLGAYAEWAFGKNRTERRDARRAKR